jgi:hypothetical protein
MNYLFCQLVSEKQLVIFDGFEDHAVKRTVAFLCRSIFRCSNPLERSLLCYNQSLQRLCFPVDQTLQFELLI